MRSQSQRHPLERFTAKRIIEEGHQRPGRKLELSGIPGLNASLTLGIFQAKSAQITLGDLDQ
jgi:hypothetical protein